MHWVRYLCITAHSCGMRCHQGQSFMEEKAENKRENGSIITSLESHESLVYFSLYPLKSPKISESAQNKKCLKA